MYICTVGVVWPDPTTALNHSARASRLDSSIALRGCAACRCTACGVGGTTLCCIIIALNCRLPRYHCYILHCTTVLPWYHSYSAILQFYTLHYPICKLLSTSENITLANTVGTSLLTSTMYDSFLPPCRSCTSSPEVGGLLTHALPSLSSPCPLRDSLVVLSYLLLLQQQLARSPRRLVGPNIIHSLLHTPVYMPDTYSTYLIRYSISRSGQSTPHLPPAARRLAQDQNTSTSSIEIHACAVFTRETTSQP